MPLQKNRVPYFRFCLFLGAWLCLNACAPLWMPKKDVDEIHTAAHRADARSRVFLGELYEFGAGVDENPLIAAQWYQLAAKQNNADAQYYLGVLYERGNVIRRNSNESLNWLFKAAEQGHEQARILLAVIYLKDKNRRPEFAKRIRQHRLRAERGNAQAQYIMGWIYEDGVGLPVNSAEAQNWYRKAARQGNARAAWALGNLYLKINAAPANLRQSLAWYEQGASKDLKAQVKLYRLHQQGAPAANPRQAEKWRAIIARNTDPQLDAYLKRQRMVVQSQRMRHPALALRACRRLSEIDPAYNEVSDLCDRLRGQTDDKTAANVNRAQAAVAKKDWTDFGNLLSNLVAADFDTDRFRRLIGTAWRMIDDENRAIEKTAGQRLGLLETALRSDAYRKKNAAQIPAWIRSFKNTLAQGLREHPADEGLLAIAAKGRSIIAGLERKLKAPPPPPPEPEMTAEIPEEPLADAEPGDEEFRQAQDLFDNGQFEQAADLFEKAAKMRGFQNIAGAYLYLGISHLARIDPADVNEARKLHLKGLASFQNALRFDNDISLPEGYDKYQTVFEEARDTLR